MFLVLGGTEGGTEKVDWSVVQGPKNRGFTETGYGRGERGSEVGPESGVERPDLLVYPEGPKPGDDRQTGGVPSESLEDIYV